MASILQAAVAAIDPHNIQGFQEHTSGHDQYWRYRCNASILNKARLFEALVKAGCSDLKAHKVNKHDLYQIAGQIFFEKPSYNDCTREELSTFVLDRRLAAPGLGDSKNSLICTLRKADAQPVFHRFFDLPPELRQQVYELHAAGFPETLTTPTQPPLSRVSAQLRLEMLPVFYSSRRFKLHYHRYQHEHRTHFKPVTDTYLWLSNLSRDDLAAILRLEVTYTSIKSKSTADGPKSLKIVCCITFREDGSYDLRLEGEGAWTTNDTSTRQAVRKGMRSILDAVVLRGKLGGMKFVDLYALRRVVEDEM
jgi:hypothetical protein